MKSKQHKFDGGMMLVISYAVLFLVNAIVIIFANALFPGDVVLGTEHINTVWAIIYSVGILTLICTFVIPFAHYYEAHRKKILNSQEWMILYFVINFGAVWGITRFAEQIGLGVRSWLVVLGLAIVLDIAQGVAMMLVERFRKSK